MSEHVSQYLANAERQVSLTPDERAVGRMALQATMALSLTTEEKTDIRRALQNAVYADPAPAPWWEFLRAPARLQGLALAMLLLVGASGGGIVYAAEYALPGDMLYGVKLHVNEAFRTRLTGSPEERAKWAVERLRRRMDELHRLQARGTAETELDVAIGDHIETAAHQVETEIDALPAAAAERAALRTAVNAAIGTDQDSLRRASRINRVLKALKDRSDRFDAPAPTSIVPAVPAVVPAAEGRVDIDVDIRGSVIGGGTSSVPATMSASSGKKNGTSSAPDVREDNASASEGTSGVIDAGGTIDGTVGTPPDPAAATAPLEETADDAVDAVDGLL